MIRPALLSDLHAIQNCAHAAYDVYVEAIGRKPAPMVADFEGLVDQNAVWVHANQNVHGFIVLHANQDSLHLENIAVHPNAQGQGIGHALMDFAESHAAGLGLTKITLYTNAKMTAPLALYPKLGYVQTDRRIEDGFDRVYFTKTLAG